MIISFPLWLRAICFSGSRSMHEATLLYAHRCSSNTLWIPAQGSLSRCGEVIEAIAMWVAGHHICIFLQTAISTRCSTRWWFMMPQGISDNPSEDAGPVLTLSCCMTARTKRRQCGDQRASSEKRHSFLPR